MTPREAPAWTDANVHDPGVTLLEALAFGLSAVGLAASGRRIWRKVRTPPPPAAGDG